MCFNIWIFIIGLSSLCTNILCTYFEEFEDQYFYPSTEIYHRVPLEKYHPLFTNNFDQTFVSSNSISKYASPPKSFFKDGFDNPLLSKEQRIVQYQSTLPKYQEKQNNGEAVRHYNTNNNLDHNRVQPPFETEVYHVRLPPVIVDQTRQYHRVPSSALQHLLKGIHTNSALNGVRYPTENNNYPVHAHLQPPLLPPQQQVQQPEQLTNTPAYIPLRDFYQTDPKIQQIAKQAEHKPLIPYYAYPQNHAYPPQGQSYFPLHPYQYQLPQQYTPADNTYASQLPPRSAAKPLLIRNEVIKPNITTEKLTENNTNDANFSLRDDGSFGSLKGVELPKHLQPQGRSDFSRFGNGQRIFEENPILYNSPIYRFNKSTGKPTCANDTNSTFCLEDKEYPSEIVRLSMNNNQFLLERILADPSDSSSIKLVEGTDSNSTADNIREENGNSSAQLEGSYICPSKVTYSRPLRASNIDGEWKVVVNLKQTEGGAKYSQTIRLEECTNTAETTCNFLNGVVSSRCVQKYNLQRLLVWSYEEGIHFDVFRLPIACSCQVLSPAGKA